MTNAASLRCYLFGPLQLQWGGRPLPLPAASAARALLAYLIFHHSRDVPRGQLAGIFWGDRPEATARRSLSHALWQIRQSLGPPMDRLLAEREWVRFRFQPQDYLDVQAYEQALSAAHARPGLPDKALLKQATTLYQADLLEGYYDDWLLLERERLRESYLQALDDLLMICKQEGDLRQAMFYAKQLVLADPLRETAHRELMRIYHLQKRDRAALLQYEQLRVVLERELGVEPSRATTALYRQIASSLSGTAAPYLPQAPPPSIQEWGRLPFIGRGRERGRLIAGIQSASRNHGGLFLVEGAPGIGKSRLAEEGVAEAQWRGFLIARSKTETIAKPAPWQMWRTALEPLLTPLRVQQLSALLEPRWRSLLAAAFLPSLHPEPTPTKSARPGADEMAQLAQALRHFIRSLTAIAPLLLLLEDVHRADEASLGLLTSVAPVLSETRCLVILTARPAEVAARPVVRRVLDDLTRTLPVQRVRLGRFSEEETAALLNRALNGSKDKSEVQRLAPRLQRQTGGNPLFLVETLKALRERGALVPCEEGGWVFPEDDLPLPIPATAAELIRMQIAQLTPALRGALEALAVLGDDVKFDLIDRMSRWDVAILIASLNELVRRGFLKEEAASYRFSHDLIHDIAYQDIPPARRRALHRRVGEAVRSLHPDQVEALAHHFAAAGAQDEALRYTLLAGDRARKVFANGVALDYYREALALTGDDRARRWDLLQRMELALSGLGHVEEQAACLDEMRTLAEVLDDDTLRARTLYRQGKMVSRTGEPVRGLALLEEAAALARKASDFRLLGRCYEAAARGHWHRGDVPASLAATEAAQRYFQMAQAPQGELGVLNLRGNLYLGLLGDYEQALNSFQQMTLLARELKDAMSEHTSLLNSAISLMSLGQFRRSLELLKQPAVFFDEDAKLWMAIVAFARANNYLGLGEYDLARTEAETSLRLCLEIGEVNFAIEAHHALGRIALYHGQYAQAKAHFSEAVAAGQAGEQPHDVAVQQSYLALACLRLGEMEQARNYSAPALATLESMEKTAALLEVVYLHRFQIVEQLEGSRRAQPYLQRAYAILTDKAERIHDPELRRSFLNEILENKTILLAHELGHTPPPLLVNHLRLPRRGIPTGRPLRDDEWVAVTWTISSPEDGRVTGKVKRRRHRLMRLLTEAREQGAAPTVGHLAAALEVGQRTIERDLAALRAGGHDVPTRGARRRKPL